MKNLFTLLFLFVYVFANAQGILSGTIADKETGEVLLFANVVLYQDDKVVTGTVSDLDGNFKLDKLKGGE